jgi:hypothetical protein
MALMVPAARQSTGMRDVMMMLIQHKLGEQGLDIRRQELDYRKDLAEKEAKRQEALDKTTSTHLKSQIVLNKEKTEQARLDNMKTQATLGIKAADASAAQQANMSKVMDTIRRATALKAVEPYQEAYLKALLNPKMKSGQVSKLKEAYEDALVFHGLKQPTTKQLVRTKASDVEVRQGIQDPQQRHKNTVNQVAAQLYPGKDPNDFTPSQIRQIDSVARELEEQQKPGLWQRMLRYPSPGQRFMNRKNQAK